MSLPSFSVSRSLVVAGLVIATLCQFGCGGRGLGIVPVKGTIAFPAGQEPEYGKIYFRPIEVAEGLPSRPASGEFKSDGAFQVTSLDPNDGLIPGTYSVLFECFRKADNGGWLRAEFPDENVTVEVGASRVVLEYSPENIAYRPYRGA